MTAGGGTGGLSAPVASAKVRWREERALVGHEGAVLAVRYNPDGRYCLTCGKDRTVRLWNPATGLMIKSYVGHGREVRDVAVTRCARRGALARRGGEWGDSSGKGRCRGESRKGRTWRLSQPMPCAQHGVPCSCMPPCLLRSPSSLSPYPLAAAPLRLLLPAHPCSDNARLASGGAERGVLLWDVAAGRVLRRFKGHDNQVNAVAFNEYDSVVVSGGYDRSVRVWDCRSHSVDAVQTMDPFSDAVTSLLLSAHCIVAASIDGSIATFDIRRGRLQVDELGLEHPINCIAMSHDANCLLAASLHSTLRLLDRQSGEILNEYRGHVNEHYKLEAGLTRDDAYVVCGSEDGRLVAWDLVEGSVAGQQQGAHKGVVTGIAFHPSDKQMLSCSADGSVRVWDLQH
ncbi:unnamed protein product [Closterium sp. Naga37s-1]|nr:unnamed protein product [Closterium sp. Naga37s-1]